MRIIDSEVKLSAQWQTLSCQKPITCLHMLTFPLFQFVKFISDFRQTDIHLTTFFPGQPR